MYRAPKEEGWFILELEMKTQTILTVPQVPRHPQMSQWGFIPLFQFDNIEGPGNRGQGVS